jgi:hypothetical protein
MQTKLFIGGEFVDDSPAARSRNPFLPASGRRG